MKLAAAAVDVAKALACAGIATALGVGFSVACGIALFGWPS